MTVVIRGGPAEDQLKHLGCQGGRRVHVAAAGGGGQVEGVSSSADDEHAAATVRHRQACHSWRSVKAWLLRLQVFIESRRLFSKDTRPPERRKRDVHTPEMVYLRLLLALICTSSSYECMQLWVQDLDVWEEHGGHFP